MHPCWDDYCHVCNQADAVVGFLGPQLDLLHGDLLLDRRVQERHLLSARRIVALKGVNSLSHATAAAWRAERTLKAVV